MKLPFRANCVLFGPKGPFLWEICFDKPEGLSYCFNKIRVSLPNPRVSPVGTRACFKKSPEGAGAKIRVIRGLSKTSLHSTLKLHISHFTSLIRPHKVRDKLHVL